MKTPEELAEQWCAEHICHLQMTCHAEAFLAGYAAAQPKWISVKDRLPEDGQIALTICDNGKMFLLQKVSDEMFGVPIYWNYCCGFDKELGPNESYCYDVTHWMPLPKPPKENE